MNPLEIMKQNKPYASEYENTPMEKQEYAKELC